VRWVFSNREASIDLDVALQYEWGYRFAIVGFGFNVDSGRGAGLGVGIGVLDGLLHLRGIWQNVDFDNAPSAGFRAMGELSLACILTRVSGPDVIGSGPLDPGCRKGRVDADMLFGAGYDFAFGPIPISLRMPLRIRVLRGAVEIRPTVGVLWVAGSSG